MARKPNSMRGKKVASAAKPKKKYNGGKSIPKDVNEKYMTASRRPRRSATRRA